LTALNPKPELAYLSESTAGEGGMKRRQRSIKTTREKKIWRRRRRGGGGGGVRGV
jgi:hypothetical protein